MKTKFIVNDYALIWNLLFQASISENIYKIKQYLWETYRNEYNLTFKDKISILKDYKNFIPSNDTIYNIVIEKKEYDKIKKQAEKYRIEIMKLWDKNQKETDHLLNEIIRKELPNYTFFIVCKELNVIDHPVKSSLVIGKSINKKAPLNLLLEINMKIISNNLKKYPEENKKFKNAIIELAVLNEYATRIYNRSCYLIGKPDLLALKRQLYPYWLMYLGVKKENLNSYMMRDKIDFDINKITYNKELQEMNLEEFIDFCIKNESTIIKKTKEEVI